MDLLEKAKLEVEELKRQRDTIVAVLDAKIAIVEQTVKMLEPVYSPMSSLTVPILDDSVGITEAIERALRKVPGTPLAPTAVRDVLAEMKFKINGDNPMASVHQVLKRLVARSGSPYVVEQVDGQTMYKFDQTKEVRRPGAIAGGYDPIALAKIVRDVRSATQRQFTEMAEEAQRAVAELSKSLAMPVVVNPVTGKKIR